MNENDANLINAIDFINETKQPEEEMCIRDRYKTFSKNNRNSIYAITAKSSHWRTMRGFFIASFFTFPILCYIFVANVLYKQV